MSFVPTRPFVPATGLESPHAQTVYASIARRAHPKLERRVLGTPDGDFLEVHVGEGEPGAPLLFLLHGLEGSVESGYVRWLAAAARERGFSAAILEFRSCGRRPNRALRGYHSGEWTDPAHVLGRLRAQLRPSRVLAAGYSLGGSVLLNLLTEGPRGLVNRAAAVSVPFDLLACVRSIDDGEGWPRVYRENFVLTMREKALSKAARHPGVLDTEALSAARTIQEIDRHFTARAFGYADELDYYRRCSSGPKLSRVEVPTLLISAEDDPLAPASHLPTGVERNPHLSVVRTRHGGHVGFVEGTVFRPRFWAEEQAFAFLTA